MDNKLEQAIGKAQEQQLATGLLHTKYVLTVSQKFRKHVGNPLIELPSFSFVPPSSAWIKGI
jgi:hypothetical protein